MRRKKITQFFQEMLHRIRENEVSALGAQLTYYLILSFFPFLIFLVVLLSYTQIAIDTVLNELAYLLPPNSYSLVIGWVEETVESSNQTLLSFGMIGTIWAASRGVNAIIKGINKAYDEKEERPFWKVRGIAILAMGAITLLLLATLVFLVFGKWIGQQLFIWLNYPNYFAEVWNVAKYTGLILFMIYVFAFLYKHAPSRHLTYREVLPGAVLATLGWIITSLLFAFYVNHFGNYSKTYGSIGGIIILLVWMYLSNIIILIGGEMNAAIAFIRSGNTRKYDKLFGFKFLSDD